MLSIIIPTLNEERYLPLLLKEIGKQKFNEGIEVIVADAGSEDKTVEIARSFGCKITGGGLPAKGRNEGAKIARGEIFLFLDADNIFLPDDFLNNLIGEFKKRNLDIASFPIFPKGKLIDKIIYGFYNFFVWLFQNFSVWATNSILVKKEIFEKVGGFDEEIKIGEDHDFAKRAARIGKFGFIKTKPVLTSARRFEKYGRMKTYLNYFLFALHIIFLGPIKGKIFHYPFDHLTSKKNGNKISSMTEELPKPTFQTEFLKLKPAPFWKKKRFLFLLAVLISFIFGSIGGFFFAGYFSFEIKNLLEKLHIKFNFPLSEKVVKERIVEKPVYLPQTSQEEAIIKVVKEASPAVVSIIITKDVPKLERYYENPFEGFEEFFGPFFDFRIPQWREKEGETEKKEVGGGTAFFVSNDGLLITNAHVVSDKKADYTVLTNDGKKYPAKVLARDNLNDLAIIKIEGGPFPTLKLGNSDSLEIGQTVIAIGNSLGEFRNTVSVGVISGLKRKVTAGGGDVLETLEDVIQTDAAINRGNSGGPLLNLKGEVIGINFAMASQAENIGFAIPVNRAKKDIEQVRKTGKIVYPFLGVRYLLINENIQKENNLPVNYGAWIKKGEKGESAIFPNSPAQKLGLKEGDIILEFNGEKITTENPLAKLIIKYNPGDKVTLKIMRQGKIQTFEVILAERNE